ncbi:MAG: hypothetical protein AMJ78_08305 [Omnitrophica WOR_2 bacterium SM23_29]|nr:MAG: hypothetical protein AMJ78_08305 [Omnitrophica WOR_2 bacterium SM23_29]
MSFEKENGAILIITLWILAILTILSVGVAGRMGLELKLTGFYRDNMKALYLAKAGVERAISVIEPEDHAIDSLNERWSNNSEEQSPLFKEIKVADVGTFTVSYPFTEGRVFYGIQDEERRINFNNAPKDVIKRLIEYLHPEVGDATEIAALIEDWRDTDTIREGSGPEYDYSIEGYPRKDSYFDAVEEILLVKDMAPEIFNDIEDYITVYPAKPVGKLNINTASLPSLYALGLSEPIAQELILLRSGEDDIDGTSDDAPFNQGTFETFLKDRDISLPPESTGLVAFGSEYFRIKSYSETYNKRAHKTIVCITGPHPSEQKQEIIFWKEQ